MGSGPVTIGRGRLEATVADADGAVTIRRDGAELLADVRPWAVDGTHGDRFVRFTEGVLPKESIGARLDARRASATRAHATGVALELALADGRGAALEVELLDAWTVVLRFAADGAPLRIGVDAGVPSPVRYHGLGARHDTAFDQTGRTVWLGADRRYTGPDCPAVMRRLGGVPQGDYAPLPWLCSSAGFSLWLRTSGPGARFDLSSPLSVSARAAAGPLDLLVLCHPTPAARLRGLLRATGLPALLPEWAYGHWKSRDVYEHQRDVEDDWHGYRAHDLPLDAIVIDSPWETQYNTWEFNRHQFPDAEGLVRGMREDGVRTVVWVTPWINLESRGGQMPPGRETAAMHARPAPGYDEAARAGHFVRGADGAPLVARWWMGTGSTIDFTSPEADRWWSEQAHAVLRMGVEGIKADDGEGYYIPDDARLADGRRGAEAAWELGLGYRRSMQRALDEVHGPGRGVVFGRSGWTGQQAVGMLWGGDQASDFWSLRVLVAATLNAAASGFSNWSHDVGGYLGHRLLRRCPKELLLRWVQFGCFTPLFQSHGRFAQEAWTYDAETLDVYRRFLVLHEQLVPYVRAAAAPGARCGLPIVRPLALVDPDDPRGWAISDAYGYGPSLWVAPVLDEGRSAREAPLPRGAWRDLWTGTRVDGGASVLAAAPLERIPVWVREGALVITYRAGDVARGLGDVPPQERALEATLWGRPPSGRALARLADGTRIAWRDGRWILPAGRDVTTREID
jgi:alpha-glucosidase (family GH31 glycosyl hydrolase)